MKSIRCYCGLSQKLVEMPAAELERFLHLNELVEDFNAN